MLLVIHLDVSEMSKNLATDSKRYKWGAKKLSAMVFYFVWCVCHVVGSHETVCTSHRACCVSSARDHDTIPLVMNVFSLSLVWIEVVSRIKQELV